MSLRTASGLVALGSGALFLILTALGGSYGRATPMMPVGAMGMMSAPHVVAGSGQAAPPIPGAPEVR